jgi:hypothetical protein
MTSNSCGGGDRLFANDVLKPENNKNYKKSQKLSLNCIAILKIAYN